MVEYDVYWVKPNRAHWKVQSKCDINVVRTWAPNFDPKTGTDYIWCGNNDGQFYIITKHGEKP